MGLHHPDGLLLPLGCLHDNLHHGQLPLEPIPSLLPGVPGDLPGHDHQREDQRCQIQTLSNRSVCNAFSVTIPNHSVQFECTWVVFYSAYHFTMSCPPGHHHCKATTILFVLLQVRSYNLQMKTNCSHSC